MIPDLTDLKFGTTDVEKVMYNNEVVWERQVTPVGNEIEILGVDVISAESCSYIAMLGDTDITSVATWSIVSGSQYASIGSGGVVTILSAANNSTVTIRCSYSGKVSDKQLTLTYKSGASSQTSGETIDNGDGTTTQQTTTITDNGDGTSATTTTQVTTDGNGDVIGSQTTEQNTNSNGASTATTTQYDANGDPTSGNTMTTDTSGNVNTQDVEYNATGGSVVVGYTIDTTSNPNGGEVLSGGIDTGFIAFDGRPFTIHLKCKLDPTQQSAGGSNIFVSAVEPKGNKYAGFCVDLYKRNQVVSMASTSGSISASGFGSRITGVINGQTGSQLLQYVKTNGGAQTLTMDITYTPASYSPEYKYIIKTTPLYTSATGTSKKSDANSTLSSNSGYLPDSLQNASVTVGSYGVEHTHDMVNFEVLEFEVRKS